MKKRLWLLLLKLLRPIDVQNYEINVEIRCNLLRSPYDLRCRHALAQQAHLVLLDQMQMYMEMLYNYQSTNLNL